MTWSAERYLRFEEERTRPVRDLLSAVPDFDARFAMDLGCGPGNSSEVLAAKFPGATVMGLDSSADMIAAARERLPEITFELGGIETWAPAESFDVILANAVLQWVPDHAGLLPRLVGRLAPDGVLAVQMPDNLAEPVHVLMRETAAAGSWAEKLAAAAGSRSPLGAPERYYDLLRPFCSKVDVWRTTYHHPLQGAAGVVAWMRGTGLRPFLDPLEPSEQGEFLAAYEAALSSAYPIRTDGSLLLPFPRLFFVAIR
ncbi:MAG: trans-aconitate 2-methyltransferase [Caulobacteraceae bacterium]